MRIEKKLGKLAGVVFQLALTLVLIEGGLRLLRPYVDDLDAVLYLPSQRATFDRVESLEDLLEGTVLGWNPYQYRLGFVLNSRSFLTPEYGEEKKPGSYRILCLGDSFTFASGRVPYPQMWPVQLEKALNLSRPDPVEVFSLGVPGVGPRFELRLWELEHARVQADLVVLAFFVGNDFTDEKSHDLEPWIETAPPRASYAWRLVRNLYRLQGQAREASERHQTLENVVELEQRKGGLYLGMKPHEFGPAESDPRAYLELEARRIQIVVRSQQEEFLRLSEEVGEVLIRLSAEIRISGSELLVVLIPDDFQVNPALRSRVLKHIGLRPEDLDLDLPQRHLRSQLEEARIPYLDLLPAIRAETRTRLLYWPNNSHWNPDGNIHAGNLIANHLLETVFGAHISD